MEIIVLLILISLLIASGFLLAYLWANRNGQFDDEYTPSIRMLFDDPPLQQEGKETSSTKVEIPPPANIATH